MAVSRHPYCLWWGWVGYELFLSLGGVVSRARPSDQATHAPHEAGKPSSPSGEYPSRENAGERGFVDKFELCFRTVEDNVRMALAITRAGRFNIDASIEHHAGVVLARLEEVRRFGMNWAIASDAQAIEAQRAETGTGSVYESVVGNADAPKE